MDMSDDAAVRLLDTFGNAGAPRGQLKEHEVLWPALMDLFRRRIAFEFVDR